MKVYLDHSATTPVRPEVIRAMRPYWAKKYGNPSSVHFMGQEARAAIEDARERCAKTIGAEPNEIVFTGSGTESVNLAIKGFCAANADKGKHIITQKTEHHAVLDTCAVLEKEGFELTYLDVDKHGLVDPKKLKAAIRKDTILVTIMYANNEIGTIQPIKKLARIAHESGVVFHTDACQVGAYLDLNVKRLGVDMMTLNGSKIYGPKGVGALYIKSGLKLKPIINGGGQEFGLRSGTENVPGIVGFSVALQLAQRERVRESARLTKLRDYFLKQARSEIPSTILNGHPKLRLPNNLNLSFPGAEGEALVLRLSERGICISSGSACSSHKLETSHVLRAIGLPEYAAHCSVRFSFGHSTNKRVLDYTLRHLKKEVLELREISGAKL